MNNNFNLSPDQLNRLMGMAGQKLGTDPEKLRQQVQSGNMDGVLGSLSPAQRAQLNNFMNNPQAVEQFMANPKVQQLLQGLMGK